VTMIPNQLHLYRNYQNKKRHIGNDNVNIVYSDSPKEFKQDTIQVRYWPVAHSSTSLLCVCVCVVTVIWSGLSR
jgi:hypothetical protein